MPAATCTVTGTICNADGTPNTNVQVRARVESTEPDQGGQVTGGVGVTSDWCVAFTDDAGLFSVDLIQGAKALLEIPSINLRKLILVPATASADFADLV